MKESNELSLRELGSSDDIRRALDRLRSRMRRADDPDPMHLAFIEDDLHEGTLALEEVEAFFADVIRLLSSSETRPADLIDLADDSAVLDRLDYLVVVVNNLRRRMLHLASRGAN